MNYYEHHIGDYAEATAHLTFVEDAAYSRLIRKYYAAEKPLPVDIKTVQRLVGARTKEERDAVATVLDEFFILQEDGWHNARCNEVITDFQDGEPERKTKKTNEKIRNDRHRAERAHLFYLLNQAGQHARWNIPIDDLRELVQRFCNAPATQDAPPQTPLPEQAATLPLHQPVTPATLQVPLQATAPITPATATHKPITTTHTPIPITQYPEIKERVPPRSKPKIPIPPDFVISERVAKWANEKGYDRLPEHLEAFACKSKAKGYVNVDWDAAFMGAIREDWAGLRTSKPETHLQHQSTQRRSIHDERAATIAALTGQSSKRDNVPTIDATTGKIISDVLG